jgi:hypothetical protein
MDDEVLELLRSTPSISLGAVTVVGSYRRHNEQVRNNLKVWRDRIIAPFVRPTDHRENFLVWAPSGTGKTFFITEVAGSWPGARLTTINLAMDSNEVIKACLQEVSESKDPCFCLVDEVDGVSNDDGKYTLVFPYLDLNTQDRNRPVVFSLVGSTTASMTDMANAMRRRDKGPDLVDRVPAANRFGIPVPTLGDRLVLAVSQLHRAYAKSGRNIDEIERLALYYLLTNAELNTPRQLGEVAGRAAERNIGGLHRVMYEALFHDLDDEKMEFFHRQHEAARALWNTYLRVTP